MFGYDPRYINHGQFVFFFIEKQNKTKNLYVLVNSVTNYKCSTTHKTQIIKYENQTWMKWVDLKMI